MSWLTKPRYNLAPRLESRSKWRTAGRGEVDAQVLAPYSTAIELAQRDHGLRRNEGRIPRCRALGVAV